MAPGMDGWMAVLGDLVHENWLRNATTSFRFYHKICMSPNNHTLKLAGFLNEPSMCPVTFSVLKIKPQKN